MFDLSWPATIVSVALGACIYAAVEVAAPTISTARRASFAFLLIVIAFLFLVLLGINS